MEIKDFNIFNLSLQQKKLLKKKIGQGGESTSDDDAKATIFCVNTEALKESDKKGESDTGVSFTLVQGTPKLDYTNTRIDAIFYGVNHNIIHCFIEDEYLELHAMDFVAITSEFVVDSYMSTKVSLNDFLALKEGESIFINTNDFETATTTFQGTPSNN